MANRFMGGKKLALIIIGGLLLVLLVSQGAGFFILADGKPQAVSGYVDLSGWNFGRSGNLKLDGDWEFYWDRLITYNDILSGSQPDLYGNVPSTWTSYLLNGRRVPGQGHGTYRLRVKTDLEPGKKMGFLLNNFPSAYNVYINEEMIASSGMVTHPQYSPQTVEFTLPASEFDVIIQVTNYYHARGGLWNSIVLGSSESIVSLHNRLASMQIFFSGALLFAALTYLCLYVLRYQAKEYLYLTMLAMVLIIVIDMTNEFLIYRFFPQITFKWLVFLWYASTSWAVTLLTMLTEKLFPARFSKHIIRGFLGYTGIMTLVYMLTPVSFYTQVVSFLHIIEFFQLIFIIYLTVQAIRRKVEGSVPYMFGFIAAILVVIHDTLFANNYIKSEAGDLAYVGIAILFFVQTIVQATRYTRSYNENSLLLNKLQLVNQQRDEFMLNTSHQIRSPLTAITTLTDELLGGTNGQLTLAQKENLVLIENFGSKASNLVNDILDYSILKRGEMSLDIEPVGLRIVAENVLRVFRQINNDNTRLESAIPADLPFVWADENRLYQILYNLVGNAIKLAPRGLIRVSARAIDSIVEVSVTSNGTNISPDDLSQLFDFIKDSDGTIKEGIDGASLGLSITRQLVELQGGTIWAQNSADKGTVISFTLPMAKATVGKEQTSSPVLSIWDSAINSQGYFQVPGEGPHILLVDHNLNTLNATANILGLSGFAVTAVNDGNTAVQRISNDNSISVVLLDVMIPGKSGYDICREIRKDKTAFDLPILILTAKTATRDIVLGLDAGANDYLVKPFEKDELLARVRTLANLKESVDKAILSEIAFLQAQIKPHFLFNALSVIAALTLSDPEKARELIIDLSEYLRNSFSFSGSEDMVTLSQEIELVNAYVAIEKARFGSRLDFQLIADDIHAVTMPRLVLQPLVENAIGHGIFNKPRGGYVQLHVEQRLGRLHFSVVDNGVGMTKLQVDNLFSGTSAQGVGLGNINKRLLKYYGRGLTVHSIPGQGTTVTFSIPWQIQSKVEGG